MDTSKYIPDSLDDIGKDDLGKAKVAIGFARLRTDRRHLLISVVSALIAASGIGLGLYLSGQKSLEFQQQSLRAEITLRFLDTPRRERLAYVTLVRELNILDEDVLDRLETAAREDRPPAENTALLIDAALDDQMITRFETVMTDITSGDSQRRRQARRDLHSLVVACGVEACLKFFDDRLNPGNLLTGESYRRALGITVALGYFSAEEARRFDAYSGRAALLKKLEDLQSIGEPAIESAARQAIAVWHG